jgi:hypothetical protein
MKFRTSLAVLAGIAALGAAPQLRADVYTDATFDLFDNGFDNLDISSVSVTDDGTNLTISVTTRGFQNWTKYMMYFDTAPGGTSSNAWSRPVDLNGRQIDRFIGSWVDQPSGNSQFVSWTGSGWNWGSETVFSNSVSGNTVSWTISLAALGVGAGQTFYFDIATSGGGADPGVDHLSRSTAATSGWGSASTAGDFLAYTTTPTPGALALLGLAGLAGRRRR